MDGEDRVVGIQLARKQQLYTERQEPRFELIQFSREFSFERGIAAFVRQLQQRAQIAQLSLDVAPLLDLTLKGRLLTADFRRSLGIAPELRLSGLGFQLAEFCRHAGEVKDAPGVPRLVHLPLEPEFVPHPTWSDPFILDRRGSHGAVLGSFGPKDAVKPYERAKYNTAVSKHIAVAAVKCARGPGLETVL